MRKCIRCGAEMREDCAIKVEAPGTASSFPPTPASCSAAG